MPIYEYRCQKCERHVEVMQRMSDPPLTECSECGGDLKKLISAPAFQFKGTGWYVTDYARKGEGGKKEGGASSSSSESSSSGDSGSSGDGGSGGSKGSDSGSASGSKKDD